MCIIQKTFIINIYNIDPPNTLEVRGVIKWIYLRV